MSDRTANLPLFLDIATEAALTGGAVLQSYWGKLNEVDEIEEKGRPGDLVTIADRTAEVAILKVLRRHFPAHDILAEESGHLKQTNSPYLWAIDPLDGTTNYAHSYPGFAVSIGLLIDGVPEVGAIFDPVRQELFRGATGLGATLNRVPIRVSTTPTLTKSLLVTGFAYDRTTQPDTNYAEFSYLTHLTQGVRRSGAASLDLAYVACGRLDGYWERGLSPWDMVGGVAIVREAGGRVTAYDGSPFDVQSGRIVATNDRIHQELSDRLLEIESNDWVSF